MKSHLPPPPRPEHGGYWNGESNRERMVRELLDARSRGMMSLVVAIAQAIALALLALAFVWLCAAM